MTADKQKKQHDALNDEMFEVEWELLEKIGSLVDAEWDSPTLKSKIEELVKQRTRLFSELDKAGYFD